MTLDQFRNVAVVGPQVRYGSNTEVEPVEADFRFIPQSRHPAGALGCLLSAKHGPMQCSKSDCYSIISSARASTSAAQ